MFCCKLPKITASVGEQRQNSSSLFRVTQPDIIEVSLFVAFSVSV